MFKNQERKTDLTKKHIQVLFQHLQIREKKRPNNDQPATTESTTGPRQLFNKQTSRLSKRNLPQEITKQSTHHFEEQQTIHNQPINLRSSTKQHSIP